MNYRELLDKCKSQPGWLASKEEKDKLAYAKYIDWVEKQNNENKKNRKDNQSIRYR